MKNILSVFSFLFILHIVSAQVPEGYFTPPLKIPLVLSGTFGELRSNHFHSGIDIKTQGRKGLNAHAAANGYVSRIKISHHGYGKALYIQHPNGYTTVYAHLKKFAPKIEAYVKRNQYRKESYEIELFPKSDEILVTKDEIVAYTGNSGGSGGPHLHYEIRDAQSRPMNAMLFGIDIADTRKPTVNSVWLYPLDEQSQINEQCTPYRLKIFPQEDGTILCEKVTAHGNIGVGINTSDKQNAASNRNGIYKISSKVNGTPNFELEMKRFSFSETRYINRLIDYSYFKKNRSRITKLFIQPNNPLSIYSNSPSDGVLQINDQLSYNVEVSVADAKENEKLIRIPITGKEIPIQSQESPEDTHIASPQKTFNFSTDYASISIPKKALYDRTYLKIEELPNNRLKIHNNKVPLHKYMSLSFSLANESQKEKCYIGSFTDENRPHYVGATIKEDRITARTRDFGSFGIFKDTVAPKIRPINFSNKKWISANKTLRVSISDSQTGIKSYRATINGRFALMEYDYKTNLLIYTFKDGISVPGENKLKVTVKDKVGNTKVYEAIFFRKQ